jgi:hypothetical protein
MTLAEEVRDVVDEGGGTIIGLPSILTAMPRGRKVTVLIVRNRGMTDKGSGKSEVFAKWTVAI